jgi:glycosyltransferase involved in cell wall biosynthesis
VRLHSYEAHSPFPLLVDWRRVSELIFPADHIREYVDNALNLSDRVRTNVVSLVHDVKTFARDKLPEARWTLGMIGYNSSNKHPLMTLDILARLRRHDKRWRLRLVGHPFAKAHPAESDPGYAKSFWNAVRSSGLRDAVTASPFTDDIARWLTRVGFILSTSEREGMHQAVAQGMSSGAIPVVRRWPTFRSLSAAEHRTRLPSISILRRKPPPLSPTLRRDQTLT